MFNPTDKILQITSNETITKNTTKTWKRNERCRSENMAGQWNKITGTHRLFPLPQLETSCAIHSASICRFGNHYISRVEHNSYRLRHKLFSNLYDVLFSFTFDWFLPFHHPPLCVNLILCDRTDNKLTVLTNIHCAVISSLFFFNIAYSLKYHLTNHNKIVNWRF